MFEFLRRKKQGGDFNPRQILARFIEMSPPSALIYLHNDGGDLDNLGKAFFLRREKKLYSEGKHLYLTTPENFKIARDPSLNNSRVSLQFFYQRVPHKIDCKVIGRFRLPPEVAEALDFSVKSAFKILPISKIKREEKRTHKRYTLQNYGDSRVPLTTHVGFDLYLQTTNHEMPDQGAPTPLINDLRPQPYKQTDAPAFFTTKDAIKGFRDCMVDKQPHSRSVSVSKIIKDTSPGKMRKPDTEYVLGDLNVLALDIESLRDVLYFKKSSKSGLKRGQDNPFNLHPNDKILTRFSHESQHYEMLCEVMEARTQNEVVRPLEFMREEPGIPLELVDYSAGGILIESSQELLKFLLGDACPQIKEDEDYSGGQWKEVLEGLRKPLLHLTFYPKLHFPDAVREFKPELPFKFALLAQIVRSAPKRMSDSSTILQHGLQFVYEAMGIPMEPNEVVPWRYTLMKKDNDQFVRIHTNLNKLYGYLENQSLTARKSPPPRHSSQT